MTFATIVIKIIVQTAFRQARRDSGYKLLFAIRQSEKIRNLRPVKTDENFVNLCRIGINKDVVKKETGLDFEIDKLTNSIENVVTGDSFATEVSVVTPADLKNIAKNKWNFDWKFEYKQPEREVYKLTIVNNQQTIQGLISIEIKSDHVYMHLVESASFNKGKMKMYAGVPGNLVAFACKLSFQRGYDGNVSFFSKSQLVQHYIDSLGAIHAGGRIMIIDTIAALKLIDKYFP